MRLKTYTAETLSKAMELVRDDMGENAIIVSTQESDGDCRVTAAMEETAETDAFAISPRQTAESETSFDDKAGYLRQVLSVHGLPQHVAEPLIRAAMNVGEVRPSLALAAALDVGMRFKPIDVRAHDQPLILAGTPGAGKTITVAKLAARAKLADLKVFVATTDSKRAGAVEQLAAFTKILDVPLVAVATAAELTEHLDDIKAADMALIDTAGVNPLEEAEMDELAEIARAVNGEIVLVLPAGGDAMESADTAAAFADIGAQRMIITRLDMTRRLGGILAAGLGRLAVANVSINPRVADGLDRLNPVSLARLIIPEDEDGPSSPETKAAQ